MKKPTLKCSTCAGPMWASKTSRNDGTQMCQPCRRERKATGKRTCADCGGTFKWFEGPRCNSCRYQKAKVDAAEAGRFCPECGKPATAGTYCQTHASTLSRARTDPDGERKRERERVAYAAQEHSKVCEFCGDVFMTREARSRACSTVCVNALRYGWSKSRDIVVRRSPERLARHWGGRVLPSRSGGALVAGPCQWCGETFVSGPGAVYCSDSCGRSASWKRRYDTKGEFKVTDRVRFGVYERDGWACQLCGDDVPKNVHYLEPLAATLDHVIPQSLQLVPDHSPSNLQLAHRVCNVRRSNRMDYEHLFA